MPPIIQSSPITWLHAAAGSDTVNTPPLAPMICRLPHWSASTAVPATASTCAVCGDGRRENNTVVVFSACSIRICPTVSHRCARGGNRRPADTTVIHGVAVAGTPWEGKRLSRYLRQPAPYNTYTRDGLPPGPISNPGRGALEAALFPAATDYLYFVADGSGAHRFSATLAEHNKAVAQLRRR